MSGEISQFASFPLVGASVAERATFTQLNVDKGSFVSAEEAYNVVRSAQLNSQAYMQQATRMYDCTAEWKNATNHLTSLWKTQFPEEYLQMRSYKMQQQWQANYIHPSRRPRSVDFNEWIRIMRTDILTTEVYRSECIRLFSAGDNVHTFDGEFNDWADLTDHEKRHWDTVKGNVVEVYKTEVSQAKAALEPYYHTISGTANQLFVIMLQVFSSERRFNSIEDMCVLVKIVAERIGEIVDNSKFDFLNSMNVAAWTSVRATRLKYMDSSQKAKLGAIDLADATRRQYLTSNLTSKQLGGGLTLAMNEALKKEKQVFRKQLTKDFPGDQNNYLRQKLNKSMAKLLDGQNQPGVIQLTTANNFAKYLKNGSGMGGREIIQTMDDNFLDRKSHEQSIALGHYAKGQEGVIHGFVESPMIANELRVPTKEHFSLDEIQPDEITFVSNLSNLLGSRRSSRREGIVYSNVDQLGNHAATLTPPSIILPPLQINLGGVVGSIVRAETTKRKELDVIISPSVEEAGATKRQRTELTLPELGGLTLPEPGGLTLPEPDPYELFDLTDTQDDDGPAPTVIHRHSKFITLYGMSDDEAATRECVVEMLLLERKKHDARFADESYYVAGSPYEQETKDAAYERFQKQDPGEHPLYKWSDTDPETIEQFKFELYFVYQEARINKNVANKRDTRAILKLINYDWGGYETYKDIYDKIHKLNGVPREYTREEIDPFVMPERVEKSEFIPRLSPYRRAVLRSNNEKVWSDGWLSVETCDNVLHTLVYLQRGPDASQQRNLDFAAMSGTLTHIQHSLSMCENFKQTVQGMLQYCRPNSHLDIEGLQWLVPLSDAIPAEGSGKHLILGVYKFTTWGKHELHIYDSMHNRHSLATVPTHVGLPPDHTHHKYFKHFQLAVQVLLDLGIKMEKTDTVEVRTHPCLQQEDQYNCGVLSMIKADSLIRGERPSDYKDYQGQPTSSNPARELPRLWRLGFKEQFDAINNGS